MTDQTTVQQAPPGTYWSPEHHDYLPIPNEVGDAALWTGERPQDGPYTQQQKAAVDQSKLREKYEDTKKAANPLNRLETKTIEARLLPRWRLTPTVTTVGIISASLFLGGINIGLNAQEEKAAASPAISQKADVKPTPTNGAPANILTNPNLQGVTPKKS